MLLANSPVLIDRDGTCVRADRLDTVRTLYDPITGRNDEITDILKRDIHLNDNAWSRFLPIRLPTRNNPLETVVSPRQELWGRSLTTGRDLICARSYFPGHIGFPCWELQGKTITYVAIFFARRRAIVSAGYLLRGDTVDDIVAEQRPVATSGGVRA